MTGNTIYDGLILAGVAIAGAVATRFHIPLAWILESLLAAVKGQPVPEKPTDQPTTNTAPTAATAEPVALVKRPVDTPADADRVAFGFAEILALILPMLYPLIQKLLDQLAQRLGRAPTAQEQAQVVNQVLRDYQAGRLKISKPAEVELVDEMPEPPAEPVKS